MIFPKIISIEEACSILKEKTNQNFLGEIKAAVLNQKIKSVERFSTGSVSSNEHCLSIFVGNSIDDVKPKTLIYTDSLKSYFLETHNLMLEDSTIQQPLPESLTKNSDINQKEKRSYLLLIAALCKVNKIDLNERGAAKRLEELTDSSLSVGYKTILKIVDEINSFDLPKV